MKKQQFLSFFLAGLLTLSCLAEPVFATAPTDNEGSDVEITGVDLTGSGQEGGDTAQQDNGSSAQGDAVATASQLTPRSDLLTGPDGLPEFDELDCTAALLVDYTNQSVLYDQDGAQQVSCADTVKIMTALLTFEAIERGEISLSTVVTITDIMLSGVSSPDLLVGEEVTVEQLLYLLLLTSQDEAGYALARTVCESTDDFVVLMNQRAAELGCTNTNFISPNGSRSSSQYTTCYDLYLITAAAMGYQDFCDIVAEGSFTLPETNLHKSRFYYNSNYLVSDRKATNYNYTYATGVKSGSNYESGTCIVGSAEYQGRTLISIVLGVTDSLDELGNVLRPGYEMSADLFRYGFVKFYSIQVAQRGEFVSQVDVTMGNDSDYVLLTTANDVSIDLVANMTADDFNRELVIPDSIQAPVSAGDVVGQLLFSYDGTVYASVDLVAMTDVDLSLTEQTKTLISDFFRHPLVRAVIILLVLAVLVLVILVINNLVARSRYRKMRKSRERRRTSKK
jgi:D-alanyl-D-alanine carboxypeptidase (penicillin-binding protein 5/6)